MEVTAVSIRPAEPHEAPVLTEIALRSKAHWGYDDEFMRIVASELTVTREYVAENEVFVVDEKGRIAGFYSLRLEQPECELDLMFIDPPAHGKGYGRLLMEHATTEARALGCRSMTIQSDPFAEPFYLAMGASRVGEVASPSTGRMLPLLRVDLLSDPSS